MMRLFLTVASSMTAAGLVLTFLALSLLISTTKHQPAGAGSEAQVVAEGAVDAYYDIGRCHYPISTKVPSAQTWFDRGLAMTYGFNQEEAARCFERAIQADPTAAMPYWGLAYSLGPNMNNMQIESDQMAQATMALRLARLHYAHASAWERGLIDALSVRQPVPVPEDRDALNRGYADAMRALYKQHIDHPVVVALFAESLINLYPWNAWSADGTPAPTTSEMVTVIERGLDKWPNDPMLCHLYIHAMEASPTPEKALPAANRLRHAVPGSGHLVHMPSHIDILVGDYNSVVETNAQAIAVDQEYVRHQGRHNFYTIYRVHNHHFLVYGAMFDGQSKRALTTARQLVLEIPEEMLRSQVDFLDGFVPTVYHVMVRFGKWEEILNEPKPRDFLPMTNAMWHYARGLALAATNRVELADEEQREFLRACESIPDTSMLFNNSCQKIAQIAQAMLDGEIAYRRANYERAFAQLRRAVQLDDALHYDEPWGWMQPARHALGALLLEQGRHHEAEPVFREDLRRHPHNPWALLGLRECLESRGETEELVRVKQELEAATRRADIQLDRACYCRLNCRPMVK